MNNGEQRRSKECGFTLVEVMIAMAIFLLFLGIFSGAMVTTFHSVYRTQQTANAQSQLNIAFTKLDEEIRYADGISQPALNTPSSGDAEVEFSSSADGTEMCTELRLSAGGRLMQRTWPASGTPAGAAETILATDMQAENAQTGPFTRFLASNVADNQQLEIALSARDSSQVKNVTTRQRHMDITFAARNTDLTTASDQVCNAGRSYSWPSP